MSAKRSCTRSSRNEGGNLTYMYMYVYTIADDSGVCVCVHNIIMCMCLQLLVLDQGSWLKLMDHSPLPLVSTVRQTKTLNKSRYLFIVYTCTIQ